MADSARQSARTLATEPLGLSAALRAAEALADGELLRFQHGEEWIGAARVCRGVLLPAEAFEPLPGLGACEQACYLQLIRRSWGEGRNFCRLARRELESLLGLSPRRLNAVLDRLAARGALSALHRDNRGTLYRVRLRSEIAGRPSEEIELGARHLIEATEHAA